MVQSITRHAITGEAVIRGTQVPVDFVFDMMREGYEFEAIAKVLINESQSDALEAMHCALLFPEAVQGSRN